MPEDLSIKLFKKGRLLSFFFFVIYFLFINPSGVTAASCIKDNLRFANSSNTIYLTGPVSCTLTEIKSFLPSSPIELVDSTNHIWYIKANLKLEGGASLILHGSSIGGDANQLRLKSNNSINSGSTIWVRVQWGTLDINKTFITSWDESTNAPDKEYSTYKRSYIHVRSFLDSDGVTARESRMDIKDSEIGYLGYKGSEAYGVSWKVLGSSPNLFDKVNVYGDVINSHIHHNYFGAYTYGAFGMQWLNNEIDNNVQYGLDPHDDSDNLLIEGNKFHDNGIHGFICSQRCDNLTIRNNVSFKNKGNGIMLHRNTNDSLVENNQVYDNSDSGIAVFDSHNNTIRSNKSFQNKNGMRFSVGSSNNLIENNEIYSNNDNGLYFYKGSDTPTTGDGRPKKNRFADNLIHDNQNYPIRLKEADENIFETNNLSSNGKQIYIYAAQNNTFIANTVSGNNNYYYSTSNSVNTIQDTEEMSVKIGDSGSRMDLVNNQNYVIKNTKNIPTKAVPTKTYIQFTRNLSSSIVKFNRLNFKVIPNSENLEVLPEDWETASNYYKNWQETASSPALTADHLVGDLKPSSEYYVLVDGVIWNKYTSNAEGTISFNYTNGYPAIKLFEVKPTSIQSRLRKFSTPFAVFK